MAFTYKWEVTGIKCKDEVNHEGVTLRNSVCQTYWKLTGIDENGNEGSFSGATPFCAKNCCADDYCEFEKLTEADVLSWIQDVVNKDQSYKEHIDEQIQRVIDQNAVVEAEMPWAKKDEPIVTPEEGGDEETVEDTE